MAAGAGAAVLALTGRPGPSGPTLFRTGAAGPDFTGGPGSAGHNLHLREPGDATKTDEPTDPDRKRPIGGMREKYEALGAQMTFRPMGGLCR